MDKKRTQQSDELGAELTDDPSDCESVNNLQQRAEVSVANVKLDESFWQDINYSSAGKLDNLQYNGSCISAIKIIV